MSTNEPPAPDQRDADTLAHALGVLRRRWPLLLIAVVVCAGVAIANHLASTPAYQATASVAFGNASLPSVVLEVDTSSGNPEREAATNVLIARSLEVAEGVRRQLRTSVSAPDLLDAVDVEAAPNANVLQITANSTDRETSARVANAFADQYIAFQTATQLAAVDNAEEALEAQLEALPAGSPERASIEASLQRLDQLRAVANGGARVIGRATTPSAPTGMGLAMTTALGILVGLAVGLTVAFIVESADRRVETVEELEREYRARALAGIPSSSFRRRRASDRRDQLEPYRILRSALDFAAVAHSLDSILVTSAAPDEGKTTVAVDLAHAIALTGRRATLVELDLRRPSFAEHFDLDPRLGVTTALLNHDLAVRDLIVTPITDVPELGVLPSGALPPNPAELLSSQALTDVLAELNDGDTTLVLDAPPLNPVADTHELLNNPSVHGVLVVARRRSTTRDAIRQARGILDRHRADVVGLVVTGVRDERRYGYEPVTARRGADRRGAGVGASGGTSHRWPRS